METDKDPTFAEALLAQALWWARCTQLSKMSYSDAESIARRAVESAPPSIRRALGVDGDKTPDMDPPLCHACCKERVMRLDGVLMYGLSVTDFAKLRNKADKRGCKPMELLSRLESDLAAARKALDARDATAMIAQAHREKAAAVARAEKAEAQMRNDSAARQMAESGRASAFEAMCTIERARDSLRAELDKAKAELDQAKAYNSAAYKNGVVSVRAADATGRSNDCQAWLQACLHAEAERDALAAKLAEKEAARVRIYNELIAYQHERDRLAGILDRAGRILDEAAARKALDAKEQS